MRTESSLRPLPRASTLARPLQLVLTAVMALRFVAGLIILGQVLDLRKSRNVSSGMIFQLEQSLVPVQVMATLASLAALAFFVSWVHRAAVAVARRGGSLTFSPGLGVASFFIPVLNLFAPWIVLRDIANGSSNPAILPKKKTGLRMAALWLILAIGSAALNIVGTRIVVSESDVDLIGFGASLWVVAALMAVGALSALYAYVSAVQPHLSEIERALIPESPIARATPELSLEEKIRIVPNQMDDNERPELVGMLPALEGKLLMPARIVPVILHILMMFGLWNAIRGLTLYSAVVRSGYSLYGSTRPLLTSAPFNLQMTLVLLCWFLSAYWVRSAYVRLRTPALDSRWDASNAPWRYFFFLGSGKVIRDLVDRLADEGTDLTDMAKRWSASFLALKVLFFPLFMFHRTTDAALLLAIYHLLFAYTAHRGARLFREIERAQRADFLTNPSRSLASQATS